MSKKQAFKAISLMWAGSLLAAGCAFMTQVILARKLGPSDFGIFSAAFATVALLTPIAGFGIAQYWLKAFGQEGWGAIRWLPASFRFAAASSLFVILILLSWAVFGPHDALSRIIIVILSLYVIGQVVVELVSSKLQLEQRYASLALWQLLPHLVRFVMVLLLAFFCVEWMSVKNVALTYAAVASLFTLLGGGQLLRMALGYFDLKGHSLNASKGQDTKPGTTTIAFQAWPFGLAGLFHLIYFQSDIILVKYITGAEAAGIYNVAFTVMVAVYMLPTVIYQKFLLPKMHRWANHDRQRFHQVYRQGNIAMLGLGTGAMLVIWAASFWSIPFLFGIQYKGAIFLLNLLAVCAPIIFVASSVGATLVTKDHMRRKVKYMGAVAVLNILLNLALIPSFGAVGAVVATLCSNLLLLIIYYVSAQRVVFCADINRSDFK